MKILIVKTSAIGDVIHTLPALHALRRAYPEARIDWLIEEAAADLILGHPSLQRVLVAKRKSWLHRLRGGERLVALKEIRDFFHELREVKYDLLLDFQGLLKSSIWVALARARRKVGFGRGMEHAEGSYLFLNERIPPVSMEHHAMERELMLLRAIGVETDQPVCRLPVPEAAWQAVENLLCHHGISPGESLIAINPMTTWPTKHWENDRFAQVADRLTAAGHRVAFTGGPQDREAVGAICNAMKAPALNLAGKTSLKELAALFQLARAVLATDTGPMHLAAAVGTPVVALFGPTAPWRTGPVGEAHRILRAEAPCSPCFKKECSTRECMKGITVAQVLAAFRMRLPQPKCNVQEPRVQR